MIDDKDKNESGNNFPEDDTFGDENFDIDAEYGFEDSHDTEASHTEHAASPSDELTSPTPTDTGDPFYAPEITPSDDYEDDDTEDDDEPAIDSFDMSDDEKSEEEEDVFESYDEEDDPFELADEDDSFSTSDDTADGVGGTSPAGAPVKLIGGFAAAVAFAFITWQMFSGGSDDTPEIQTQAQATETKQPPSELDGLFAKAESDFDAIEQDVLSNTGPEDSSDTDKIAQQQPPSDNQMTASLTPPTDDKAMTVAQQTEPQVMDTPAPTSPAQPTVVQADVDLSQIEGLIQEYNEVMSARMRRIESNIRSVSDDLDDINRNLGNMGDQVAGMGHLVSNMSDQFQMLGSSQETDRKEMARQEMFANPSLHVHAIIPGRAWLKKHDGGILTVSEGDLLGEYGKVLAIDASSGAVVTSSGVTLR